MKHEKQLLVPERHLIYTAVADAVLHGPYIDQVKSFENDELMDDEIINTIWSVAYDTAMLLEQQGLLLDAVLPRLLTSYPH